MTPARYSTAAIALHWTLAAALAFMIALGWQMEDLPRGPALFWIIQLHKSVGIAILLLSVARLVVRFVKQRPAANADHGWAQRLAGVVHFGLYFFMIGAPLTGWAIVSTSQIKIETLLFGIVPWPHLPILSGLEGSARAGFHQAFENMHGLLAWIGIALFALHVAGAVRHQLLLGEPLIEKMLPLRRTLTRNASAVAIAAALALVGAGFAIGSAIRAPVVVTPAAPPPVPAAPPLPEPVAPPAVEPPNNTIAETEGNATAALPEPVIAEPDEDEAAAPAILPVWVVQPGGRLGFTARWNGNPVIGRFDTWTADIRFHQKALDRSTIRVTIDLASANTADSQRDGTLQSDSFFDSAKHPRAVFVSRSIRALGGDRYEARGTLELRGATRPVTLAFRLRIEGTDADVRGDATITRTAFGVGTGDYATTSEIAGEVAIDFAFKAVRK